MVNDPRAIQKRVDEMTSKLIRITQDIDELEHDVTQLNRSLDSFTYVTDTYSFFITHDDEENYIDDINYNICWRHSTPKCSINDVQSRKKEKTATKTVHCLSSQSTKSHRITSHPIEWDGINFIDSMILSNVYKTQADRQLTENDNN